MTFLCPSVNLWAISLFTKHTCYQVQKPSISSKISCMWTMYYWTGNNSSLTFFWTKITRTIVLGIIIVIPIPIWKFTIWWNTLHQPLSVIPKNYMFCRVYISRTCCYRHHPLFYSDNCIFPKETQHSCLLHQQHEARILQYQIIFVKKLQTFSHFLHFWFWSHNQAIAGCFYGSNNCIVLLNLNLILEIGLVGKVQIWNNCYRKRETSARLLHCEQKYPLDLVK